MGLENPLHLLLVAVVVLVVFGPKRLPDIGRSLGRGIREFKDSISGEPDVPAAHSAGTVGAGPASEPVDEPRVPPAASA